MPANIPTLINNLKNLRIVQRSVVIGANDRVRRRLQLAPIVLESQVASLMDRVLDYLEVKKAPHSRSAPLLIANSRIISVAVHPVKLCFIGTSLVVQEKVSLVRTHTWLDWFLSRSHNASAITWSARETATVVEDKQVSTQLVLDVERLLDVFANDWRLANK